MKLFVLSGFTIITFSLLSCNMRDSSEKLAEMNAVDYREELAPFYHGVASGDATHEGVIIWTRVTPRSHGLQKVDWEMALDEQFEELVASGSARTDSLRDYTVKIDVEGLQAGTRYYYRFKSADNYSITGRTQTSPAEIRELKFGVVSCANYEWGYFNAYDALADVELDAVLHLGDYIYEHGPGSYGDTTIGRFHRPPHELFTLADYRTRYAQYRLDPGLQKAHQMHPFFVIWDDHEVANNSYKSGAQNHQPEEGDYELRKQAAVQAYYEWLPIRESENQKLYRSFEYGPLAEMILLDERLEGREAPAERPEDSHLQRSMLGKEQLEWLKDRLSNSRSQFKLIGNQVIFSELELSKARPNNPVNLDAWDGYAAERDEIGNYIHDMHINDVVFVTGDTHASWAFEVPLTISEYRQNHTAVAIELGTPSISSSNWNESRPDSLVRLSEQTILDSNPHLKYVNGREHGFLVLRLNPGGLEAEWHYVDNLRSAEYNSRATEKISAAKESNHFDLNDQ